MFSGGARFAWLSVAVALLLAGVFFGMHKLQESDGVGRAPAAEHAKDDRAYEVDSGDLSFDEGMQRAGIEVPGCALDSLRYALIDDGLGFYYKTYMHIYSSEECLNGFLAANGMRTALQTEQIGGSELESPLRFRSRWMNEGVIRRMEWNLGPDQRFQEFSVGKQNQYSIQALVQHVPGSSAVQAYVYASHGG
ncbi:hypothetical protein [Micromonospora sp. NPDC005171]|uniref:hypothetical protein n=1 Tax=Micromonospora sp. NPDC005171 TaxID=3156866 RepID=UPI0033B58B50